MNVQSNRYGAQLENDGYGACRVHVEADGDNRTWLPLLSQSARVMLLCTTSLMGVDISEPMLARAVRVEAGPQIGFLRADAQRLPLRDETVDAVVSIAVLQLVPDPAAALAEMARVLRPGGRLAVMVPTAGRVARFWRMLPNIGAYMFGEDELGDILEGHGFASVRTKNFGPIQWVRGKRG